MPRHDMPCHNIPCTISARGTRTTVRCLSCAQSTCSQQQQRHACMHACKGVAHPQASVWGNKARYQGEAQSGKETERKGWESGRGRRGMYVRSSVLPIQARERDGLEDTQDECVPPQRFARTVHVRSVKLMHVTVEKSSSSCLVQSTSFLTMHSSRSTLGAIHSGASVSITERVP